MPGWPLDEQGRFVILAGLLLFLIVVNLLKWRTLGRNTEELVRIAKSLELLVLDMDERVSQVRHAVRNAKLLSDRVRGDGGREE